MKCEYHNYIAGRCFVCGHIQPVINFEREIIPRKKKINSEFQLLVDDFMTYLGEDTHKKGNFAKYAHWIKIIGKDELMKFWSYMKSRNIRSPKYFFGYIRSRKFKS